MIDGDEDLEDGDELALRDQVRLARLVDQLRDLAHRPVHRQVLELVQDHQPEEDAERRDDRGRSSAACGRCSRRRRPGRGPAARGWLRRPAGASPPGALRLRRGRLRLLRDATTGAASPITIVTTSAATAPRPQSRSMATRSSGSCSFNVSCIAAACSQSVPAATCRRSERSGCPLPPSVRGRRPAPAGYSTMSPRYRWFVGT